MIGVTVGVGLSSDEYDCVGYSVQKEGLNLDDALELCVFALRGAGFQIPDGVSLAFIDEGETFLGELDLPDESLDTDISDLDTPDNFPCYVDEE